MKNGSKVIIAALILAMPIGYALSDYTVTQGVGTTVFAWVTGGKVLPAAVPTTSAGVEISPATAAAQTTGNSSLSTIAANTTGAATAANQTTEITSLATIATNTGAAIPAGSAIIGKVGIDQTTPGTTNGVQINAAVPAGANTIGTVGQLPYPVGAVAYTATATGTTAATTATLAGATGVTTYLCGFSIRANATAALTGNATVTGLTPATMNFTQWVAPNASGLGITEMIFQPCLNASATNTSIAVVSVGALTGGVTSVSAWGFKL